ncbi:ankyrin repeat-containing protein At5g02620-like [Pistacia vera]|uniref:ankyrin repeat-containing protein At5g02620-like n=1 Tax=Pistacia vera TaxID=55513 RepID=UPI001263A556|nr:ankyrin repeat-containing protein At5g02620-like [Pistacia vera]
MDLVSDGSNREIDPCLYEAAFKGNIELFKETNQHLNLLVTPIKNTIVDIYITSPSPIPKSREFVKEILEICPSLLLQRNAHGDTTLHLAARCGHVAIVEVLIELAESQGEELESGVGAKQQMLRMKNNEVDTALHEAVRNNYIGVVEILTKEDPEFSYSTNNFGETPLYIAAEGRSLDVVTKILETCKSASHEGTDGKTALHAAVLSGDLDIVKAILEKKGRLTFKRSR